MKKVIDFIKKYWGVVVAVLGAILGLILLRERKDPPHIQPPEEPQEEKPKDFIAEHEEEKNESDKEIDSMSRSELIDDINSEYD